MTNDDLECFKLAFGYAQAHRFARLGQSVEGMHLVGADGDIDSDFRDMIVRVYRAVKQAKLACEEG